MHLTRRQRDTLVIFADGLAAEGLTPTLGSVARKLGVAKATAHEHATALEGKGMLVRHNDAAGNKVAFLPRPWTLSAAGYEAIGREPPQPPSALVALCKAWDRATTEQRAKFIELRAEPWAHERRRGHL